MSKVLARMRVWWAASGRSLRAPGVVLGVAALAFLLWWLPRYQVAHTPGIAGEKRFESEDEARKTLAQLLGGTVVLLGLYFSAKTYGLSQQGQITDRYTKAIEQLGKSEGGKPNIEVRLGAIYALERIAIDSPRDHWTIMEVLTAYVRRNAPLEPEREYKFDEKLPTEIQAILTVIGRRRLDSGREQPRQRLDLSRSQLWNAAFDGNFEGVWMSYADLRGSSLSYANFRNAKLWYVNLQKAAVRGTDLYQADCFLADFRGAHFLRNDFREAGLQGCHFEGAELEGVNLNGAKIRGAHFNDVLELTVAQVQVAEDWADASYSPGLRTKLGLKEPADEAAKGS